MCTFYIHIGTIYIFAKYTDVVNEVYVLYNMKIISLKGLQNQLTVKYLLFTYLFAFAFVFKVVICEVNFVVIPFLAKDVLVYFRQCVAPVLSNPRELTL